MAGQDFGSGHWAYIYMCNMYVSARTLMVDIFCSVTRINADQTHQTNLASPLPICPVSFFIFSHGSNLYFRNNLSVLTRHGSRKLFFFWGGGGSPRIYPCVENKCININNYEMIRTQIYTYFLLYVNRIMCGGSDN